MTKICPLCGAELIQVSSYFICTGKVEDSLLGRVQCAYRIQTCQMEAHETIMKALDLWFNKGGKEQCQNGS